VEKMKPETERKRKMDNEKMEKLAELLGVDVIDYGSDDDAMCRQYDDFLDEVHEGNASCCGIAVIPSKFVKENDPVAYRCGFTDWLDSEIKNSNLVELAGQYLTPEQLQDLKEDLKGAIDAL